MRVSSIVLTCLACSTAFAVEQAPTEVAPAEIPLRAVHSYSLQGGWWSADAEVLSRWGVYLGVGVPWIAAPLAFLTGATWVVPIGGRVGYQYTLTSRWSLRGSIHGALSVSNEGGKCGCESSGATTRGFGFAEIGVRHQFPGGIILGADVPVFAIKYPHKDFPPPQSLAFSQAYIGYSWGRR